MIGEISVVIKPGSLGEAGQDFKGAATPEACQDIAKALDLPELKSFNWSLHARRQNRGFHLSGHIAADLVQSCVVSLEPVCQSLREDVDQLFMPETPANHRRKPDDEPEDVEIDLDAPEPFSGTQADVGPFLVELLTVSIDPYPRAPGAGLDPAIAIETEAGPLAAALEKLKTGKK